MSAKAPATIEDLYNVPDNAKAELVNGEIVLMSPTGGLPGYAADEIFASIREYGRRTGNGYAVGDNRAFIVNLPNRKSLSPDAAFHNGEMTLRFYEGAPLFAVEVRSENDYGPSAQGKIASKIRDYFDAGTQVVWDVDVLRDNVVRVYRASNPDEPTVYHRGERAEAEPALPGWTMPVDDLFDATRKSLQ
ncbi:MAG: Uma2 family endonuclease [Chloroflexi bacterium]|nr:Uma2 family endonuclease [Chloroflexota bacterium]